jgi:hypothetical protein
MALQGLEAKVLRLSEFFSRVPFPQTEEPTDWYSYLASFKGELGNIYNDVSLLATMMAKEFLQACFELPDFDAAAKPQGAAGLDVDVRTQQGSRVIAEIKTTSPYGSGDLGAQQGETFRKDAGKLTRTPAEHRFFFVTERSTFDVLKKPKYREMFAGIRVVLLPSGEELRS